MKKKIRFGNLFLVIPFSIFLIIINIIRIIRVPITIDETGYNTTDSYRDLITESYPSSNNHILHSVIRKFFIETFSDDPFFYRLDSLLAQIIYLVFAFLLCRLLLKNRWWELLGFIILSTLSPLIFDFWGLSRGYADAMCCMTVSIYFLTEYQASWKLKYLAYSFLSAILAVWGNFALLNYFIGLTGILLLNNLVLKQNKPSGQFKKEMLTIVSSIILLGVLIAKPLITLQTSGEFYYGGKNGFFIDTINSLSMFDLFINNNKNILVKLINYSVVALVFVAGFFWTAQYFKNRYYKMVIGQDALHGFTLSMLLILPSASIILQHQLFGTNYLTDRTALFFVILFAIQLIYFLYYARKFVPISSGGVFALLFSFVIWNFFINLNLNMAFIWWFDRDDVHVLQRIAEEAKGKNRKIKLGVRWNLGGGIGYAVNKYYKDVFLPVSSVNLQSVDTSYDYVYVELWDLDKIPKMYKRDTEFVGGAYILLKK